MHVIEACTCIYDKKKHNTYVFPYVFAFRAKKHVRVSDIINDAQSGIVYRTRRVLIEITLGTENYEVFQTAPETSELIKADVTGTIPKWVKGTLLRNAPAKFEFDKQQPKHAFKHWFDGLALLHAFSINEGEVTYKSKYLRTQAFVKGEEQKRPAYTEFSTAKVPDPCENIFSRLFSYFTPLQRSDNSSVNIVEIQGKLFANSDSQLMAEVDPSSLDIMDVVNIEKDLSFKSKY